MYDKTRTRNEKKSRGYVKHLRLDAEHGKTVATVPFIPMHEAIVPDWYECLQSLAYVIRKDDYGMMNEDDLQILRSIGYTKDIVSEKIALGAILSAIGVKKSSVAIECYSVNLARSPRLLAIALIGVQCAMQGLKCNPSLERDLIARLQHKDIKKVPKLCRIGIDIFRAHWTDKLPRKADILAKQRFLENSRKAPRKQVVKTLKFVESVNERDQSNEAEDLSVSGLATNYQYSLGSVRLYFASSHNRGKHVATIKLQDKANGQIIDLGTIRDHKTRKSQGLFFSCDRIVARSHEKQSSHKASVKRSRMEVSREIESLEIQIKELKTEQIAYLDSDRNIKALQRVRDSLTEPLRRVRDGLDENCPIRDLDKRIKAIKRVMPSDRSNEISETEKRLHKLKVELLESDEFPIPDHLLADTLDLLKSLGLFPNQFIKSLPSDSPLSGDQFWDDMGVKVSFNGDRPISLEKDLRKSRQQRYSAEVEARRKAEATAKMRSTESKKTQGTEADKPRLIARLNQEQPEQTSLTIKRTNRKFRSYRTR